MPRMGYALHSTTIIRCYAYASADKQSVPLTIFPTPKGASWQDITIQFIDGHTVRVTCQYNDTTVSRLYNFTQMGMVDRRTGSPNKQWALLHGFAEEHGEFTWRNARANPKQKQQKQELKKVLQRFFGIEDVDPIIYIRNSNGHGYYQALFSVLPE